MKTPTITTIRQYIQQSEEREKNVTSAPWIPKSPFEETISLIHEPTPNCETFDWQFVADIPNPESPEERTVPEKAVKANAIFIASSRTEIPKLRRALDMAVEGLEAYAELKDSEHGTRYWAECQLKKMSELLKP